jgi:hypothetical protein
MFEVGSTVALTDASGRDIGSVLIDEVTPLWVCGTFTPGADFSQVQPLFREFEELVNDQILSLLDPVMERMAQLGIRLTDGTLPRDLQIYSVDGGANWRPPAYER